MGARLREDMVAVSCGLGNCMGQSGVIVHSGARVGQRWVIVHSGARVGKVSMVGVAVRGCAAYISQGFGIPLTTWEALPEIRQTEVTTVYRAVGGPDGGKEIRKIGSQKTGAVAK
jgi:hypothetical protein